jgi:Cd2+/Zn2+-exporting ATPase
MAQVESAMEAGTGQKPGHAATPSPGAILSGPERRAISRDVALAMLAGGLLLLAIAWRYLIPGGARLSDLIAGLASLLVAPPVAMGAWYSLRSPSLHGVTDRLVALAMLAAWATGDMITAALLPVVMMFGHALEERSVLGSREAIRALGQLTGGRVRRVGADGQIEEIDADALALYDEIEVVPGARIPADGIVKTGESNVDNAPITGESLPVAVTGGSDVFAGALNLDGLLRIQITRTGVQSTLGQIVESMQIAEQAKPPVTQQLERYMGAYVGLVLLIAAIVWFSTSNASAMLAVIVAACPCSLVLAAPATAIAGIAVGARHGVLFKNTAFLEKMADLDSLIVDKTGTLTYGDLRLTRILTEPGVDADDAVMLAARLGAGSAHPLSRALVAYARTRSQDVIRPPIHTREEFGYGVVAKTLIGVAVLGRDELLRKHISDLSPAPADLDGPGCGIGLNGQLLARFEFADTCRAEAFEALADLKAMGLVRQALLTGDKEAIAHRIAKQVGIDTVRADALPQDKLRFVIDELAAGWRPLVVGDGVNDALALKAGAVGIAMGGRGIDIAAASADIVLIHGDLRRIGAAVRLGRLCRKTSATSAALGLGWTVAIIALAAAGVTGAIGAAILHNVGTVLVILNAGRLLRFEDSGKAGGR